MTVPDDFDRVLENLGAGPDRVSLATLTAETDALVVLLQRDHFCTNCREQVQAVKHRYDEFRERGAQAVSIVPEPPHRVRAWQDRFDLPYPLLADPEAAAGDAFGQPVRFGWLGSWSDLLGRMPEAVLVSGGDDPEVVWTHRGSSTFDRPDLDAILAQVDAHTGTSDGGPGSDAGTAGGEAGSAGSEAGTAEMDAGKAEREAGTAGNGAGTDPSTVD